MGELCLLSLPLRLLAHLCVCVGGWGLCVYVCVCVKAQVGALQKQQQLLR